MILYCLLLLVLTHNTSDAKAEIHNSLKTNLALQPYLALRIHYTNHNYAGENYTCDYHYRDSEEILNYRGKESYSWYINKDNIMTSINKHTVTIRQSRNGLPDVLSLLGITLPIIHADKTIRTFVHDVVLHGTVSKSDDGTIVIKHSISGTDFTMTFEKVNEYRLVRLESVGNTVKTRSDLSYNKNSNIPFKVHYTSSIVGHSDEYSSTSIIELLSPSQRQISDAFDFRLKPGQEVIDLVQNKRAVVGSDGSVDYKKANMLNVPNIHMVSSTSNTTSHLVNKQMLTESDGYPYTYYVMLLISSILLATGLFVIARRRIRSIT